MGISQKVLVIIPFFNEEGSIKKVIEGVRIRQFTLKKI